MRFNFWRKHTEWGQRNEAGTARAIIMDTKSAAQHLGRLSAGKPKNFSKAERNRRSQRMKEINARRRAEKG